MTRGDYINPEDTINVSAEVAEQVPRLLARARSYYRSGKGAIQAMAKEYFRRCIACCDEVLTLTGDQNVEAAIYKARALHKLGESFDALQCLDQAAGMKNPEQRQIQVIAHYRRRWQREEEDDDTRF